MSDSLNIQLDGSQIVQGVDDVLAALREFKVAIAEFSNNDPTGRVRAEVQALATSATTVVQTVESTLGSLRGSVDKALNDAASNARAGGRKVGEAAAAGIDEGMQSLRNKSASNIDARTLLGLDPDMVRKSAVASAEIFKESFRAQSAGRVDSRVLLGLPSRDEMKTVGAEIAAQMRDGVQAEALRSVGAIGVDPRTLLGLQSDRVAKSAAASASVFQESFKAEALREGAASNVDVRTLLGLTPQRLVESARSAAAVFEEAFNARMNALGGVARSQVNQATSQASGAFSVVSSGSRFGTVVDPSEAEAQKALTLATKDSAAAQKLAREETDALNKSSGAAAREGAKDLQSAMRGVSGAAGALFLTYGALVPLMTAFFTVSAVKESITTFKDLEYQLKFVQAIAEDTSVSVQNMADSVTKSAADLGVAPVEAAKGLRMLAQAGLETTQALQALPIVMKVATIGELSMQEAAETLTGATYAFGLSLDGMERVGDVFTKAASVSNTSVQGISESMKQASTVAEQYKLSVEDVGTALVALAKRNITGGAAGTAFRSLMDEFATPKGQAQQVAQQLGITLFDPIKNTAKDFFDNFLPDLRKKLEVFNPASQTFIMNRLGGTRGGKALSALMGMSDADLADIHSQLQNAQGMATRAMLELNDSVQGDLNKLRSTFDASLAAAASEGVEPLRASLQKLKDVVGSADFIAAVAGLTTAFTLLLQATASIAAILTSPAGMVASVTLALAIFTPLGGMVATTAREMLGFAAASTATAAASSAATAGAAGLLSMLLRFAGVVGVILAVATVVGVLYNKLSEKDPIDKAIQYTEGLIKKELDYQKSLDDSITKLKVKLGLQVGPTPDMKDFDAKVAAAKADYDTKTAKADLPQNQGAFAIQKQAMDALLKWKNLQQDQREIERLRMEDVMKEMALRDLENKDAQKQADKLRASFGSGSQTFTPTNKGASNKDYSNALRDINLEIQQQEALSSIQDKSFDQQEKLLDFQYKTGVIDFKDYQDQLTKVQNEQATVRIANAKSEMQIAQSGYETLEALVQKKAAAAAASAKGGDPHAASQAVLDSAANDELALQNKLLATQSKYAAVVDQNYKQQLDAIQKLLEPSASLVQNADKETAALKNNFDQEMARVSVKQNILQLSERDQFVQEEVLKSTNAIEDQLSKIKAARADLLTKVDLTSQDVPEAELHRLNVMLLQIMNLQDLLDGARGKAASVAADAFDAKKINEIAKSLDTGIADALTTGIFDGSKAGAVKMRKVLEDELLRKPFTMVIQALLQPVANGIASAAYSAFGLSGGGAGGAGNLLSAGGSLLNAGSVGYQYLTGGMSGANAFGTLSANATGGGLDAFLATNGAYGTAAGAAGGISPVLGAGGAQIGTTFGVVDAGAVGAVGATTDAAVVGGASSALAGGATAALAAIPVAGWIAIAAIAAYSIFGGKGGGPKDSSAFGSIARDGVDPAGGSTIAQSVQGLYSSVAAANGITDTVIKNLGVFYAKDPQGTAQTQLEIAGGSYSRASMYGGNFENAGRTDLEFQNAVALASAQLVIKNLQDVVKGPVGDYLKTFDIATASLADMQQALKVAQDVGAFDTALDSMGPAMKRVNDLSVLGKEAFITIAGGIQTLTTRLQSYYNNFYSDAEKRAATVHTIGETLRNAGLDVTDTQVASSTRDQFRKLAEAIDVTSTAGATAYNAILSVSDAFASITPAATDTATALQSQVDQWKGVVDQLTTFGKDLTTFKNQLTVGSSSPLSPYDQYTAAKGQLSDVYTKALGGDADSQKNFQSIAQQFLTSSKDVYASSDQYTTDFQYVMSLIDSLSSSTTTQLTDAQQKAQDAQNQLSAVTGVQEAVQGAGFDIVAAVNSVNSSVKDLITAVVASNAAAVVTAGTGGTDVGSGSGSGGGSGGGAGSGFDGSGGGGGAYIGGDGNGGPIMTFARGGLASGWALVGEDGPELVNFSSPSRVYTASQTRAALSSGNTDALLQDLIARVEMLTQVSGEGLATVAQSTHEAANKVVQGHSSAAWKKNSQPSLNA